MRHTLADLFTPDERARLCDPCSNIDHWRDWPDRGAHGPDKMLKPPIERCPCDGRCVRAHPEWGRDIL